MYKRIMSFVMGLLLFQGISTHSLTVNSNITEINQSITSEDLKKVLKKGLKNESEYFIKYGKENNINPLVLASISAHESGWGTSYLSNKYNNIFGISHPTKRWSIFNSKESCIKWSAEMLRNNYVNKGYTTLNSIQKIYCPDDNKWAIKINSIVNQLEKEIRVQKR